MYRVNGVSMPGSGVGVVGALGLVLLAPHVGWLAWMRPWHAGLAGLALWAFVDVACLVAMSREKPGSR
jgi:hypothetical protein